MERKIRDFAIRIKKTVYFKGIFKTFKNNLIL